jgi:hypothetical protein
VADFPLLKHEEMTLDRGMRRLSYRVLRRPSYRDMRRLSWG